MTLEQLTEDALSLPATSRAYLAEKLLESIDYEEDVPVSPEWKKEIMRRAKELDEGTVEGIPAEAVFEEIEQRLST
ncbi:MAG: addiction module protein [Verrucomicrobiota bacterium]